MQALVDKAAKLPNIAIHKPRKAIGKNTRSAMRSGMYWGYIGMIEKIIDNIREEVGTKPYVIATGGLASLYAESTDYIDIVDENLIFKGLYEIYKKQI